MRLLRLLLFFGMSFLTLPSWAHNQMGSSSAFSTYQWGNVAFRPSLEWASGQTLNVHFSIAPGQILYRHSLSVQASQGWTISKVQWPLGETGPRGHTVFKTGLVGTLNVQPKDPSLPLVLQLNYQGCSETGVCHPPQQQQIKVQPSGRPMLVFLTAPWCGPCQQLKAQLKQVPVQTWAKTHGAQWVEVQVPDDAAGMKMLQRYGVLGIPALRWYPQGKVSSAGTPTLLGAPAQSLIEAWFSSLRF